jgi:hypothetical protein
MKRPTVTIWPLAAAWTALLPFVVAHAQGFQSVSGATRTASASVPALVRTDAAAHFESVGTPATSPPVDAPVSRGAVSQPDALASAAAPAQAGAPAITQAPPAALPFSSVSGPSGGPSATESGSGPMLPASADGSASSFGLADRIVIEKAARRLYLLRGDSVLVEYPVKLGLNPYGHKQREGDFRTPEGTYYLSRRNPNSEFFLSVEVSYPNEADRARARQSGVRPGGLIMIHGQPNVPSKSPDYYANNDWTDGCIAVSNSDMVDIWQRTRLGIPIEIRP